LPDLEFDCRHWGAHRRGKRWGGRREERGTGARLAVLEVGAPWGSGCIEEGSWPFFSSIRANCCVRKKGGKRKERREKKMKEKKKKKRIKNMERKIKDNL
jgi:hypothetical protein